MVQIKDKRLGNVMEELQGIIDLAGHAEKNCEGVEVDMMRIRAKAKHIRGIFKEHGVLQANNDGGAA